MRLLTPCIAAFSPRAVTAGDGFGADVDRTTPRSCQTTYVALPASRPSYVTSWDRSRSTVGIPSVPVIGPAPLKQLEVEVGGGRARGGDADGVLATACILDRGTGTGLEEGSWIVMSACFECGTHTQQPIGGYFTTGQASGRRLNKRKAIDRWCGRDFRLKRNGLGPSERVPRRPRTRRFSRPF
jgi:hypothetical protein